MFTEVNHLFGISCLYNCLEMLRSLFFFTSIMEKATLFSTKETVVCSAEKKKKRKKNTFVEAVAVHQNHVYFLCIVRK